ncbi:MAG TPA: biotin/lipoyl-containing protein, partial [Gemmatimonadales bacterium]
MARIDVLMPQMGESIAEGTVSKWLKKVGEEVKRDEPLFEISTDKVDAEIPSPVAGVLAEIKVQEGQTVAVQTLVAVIETEKSAAAVTAPSPPSPSPSVSAQRAPAASGGVVSAAPKLAPTAAPSTAPDRPPPPST